MWLILSLVCRSWRARNGNALASAVAFFLLSIFMLHVYMPWLVMSCEFLISLIISYTITVILRLKLVPNFILSFLIRLLIGFIMSS